MTKIGVYVSNMTDKLIKPGKYLTADEYHKHRLDAVSSYPFETLPVRQHNKKINWTHNGINIQRMYLKKNCEKHLNLHLCGGEGAHIHSCY